MSGQICSLKTHPFHLVRSFMQKVWRRLDWLDCAGILHQHHLRRSHFARWFFKSAQAAAQTLASNGNFRYNNGHCRCFRLWLATQRHRHRRILCSQGSCVCGRCSGLPTTDITYYTTISNIMKHAARGMLHKICTHFSQFHKRLKRIIQN